MSTWGSPDEEDMAAQFSYTACVSLSQRGSITTGAGSGVCVSGNCPKQLPIGGIICRGGIHTLNWNGNRGSFWIVQSEFLYFR